MNTNKIQSTKFESQNAHHNEYEINKDKTHTYIKKKGTSGLCGQLYETKLLALILLRALNDDNIMEFVLGTNIAGLGAMDDIVIRYKNKGSQKSNILFLQLKHRDDPNKDKLTIESIYKENGDFSFHKYLESYLKIKQVLLSDNKSLMFKGSVEDIECEFIIYTPAAENFTKKKILKYSDAGNLIKTSKDGKIFQFKYDDNDIEELIRSFNKSRVRLLAKTVAEDIIKDNNKFKTITSNDVLKQYHIFLGQNVITIEDNKCTEEITDSVHNDKEYSTGKFKESFLLSCEEDFLLMRDVLCKELTKMKIITGQNVVDTLKHLRFKLPSDFGNRAFYFYGNAKKQQRRLDYLCSVIEKVLQSVNIQDSDYIYVKLDDSSVGSDKIIQANDLENYRLGGLIGNLLIKDQETETLRFNLDELSLSSDSIKILQRLKKLYDLSKYRLDISIQGFPKLSLKSTEQDRNLITEFLSKLTFYTNQLKEDEVESLTKMLMLHHAKTKSQDSLLEYKCDVMYLMFHDEIQKWWKESSPAYLTKACRFYEQANCDMLNIINFIYKKEMKNINVEFDTQAILSLPLDKFLNSDEKVLVLISDAIHFTSMKLIQYMEMKTDDDCIFIDLNSVIFKNCLESLKHELELSVKSVLVVSQDPTDFKSFCENIKQIVQFFKKKIIIITDSSLENNLRPMFSNYTVHKDFQNNFSNLSSKIQKKILEERKVKFQGVEITIHSAFNDIKLELLSSHLLRKIIDNKEIQIGHSLENKVYSKTINYFVHRSLCRNNNNSQDIDKGSHKDSTLQVNTLKDFQEKVVIISAGPGMGKTTLLSHIAMNTKQIHPSLWILNINLSDHENKFSEWKDSKTNINLLEAMKFLYSSTINKEDMKHSDIFNEQVLSINNNEIYFNELITPYLPTVDLSELKLLNHFYNTNNLAVLIDAFDEVGVDYIDEVIQFLCILKNSKIAYLWVASRPSDMLNRLELSLETFSFTLNPFQSLEQISVLKSIYSKKYGPNVTTDSVMDYFYTKTIANNHLDIEQEFTGVPLHMFMIATVLEDQFREIIRDGKWDALNNKLNLTTLYEGFINTKFYDIRFAEKENIEHIGERFKRKISGARKEFIDNHKKTAAYLYLDKELFLTDDERNNVKIFLNTVKRDNQESEIIECFANDHPKFIHDTFAEYFAVEHIFDILKSAEDASPIWRYLINDVFISNRFMGIRRFVNCKLKKYSQNKADSTEEYKEIVYYSLIGQYVNLSIKVKVLFIALQENLDDIVVFLLQCAKTLLIKNEENISTFLEMIQDDRHRHCVVCAAIKRHKHTVVKCLLNLIIDIDREKLKDLFRCQITYECDPYFLLLESTYKRDDLSFLINIEPELLCVILTLQYEQNYLNRKSHKTPAHSLGTYGIQIELWEHLLKVSLEQRVKILSVKDSEGQTPLHYAALENNYDFFSEIYDILGKEAFIKLCTTRDHYGFTSICMFGYDESHFNELKTLLSKIYDVPVLDVNDFVLNQLLKLYPKNICEVWLYVLSDALTSVDNTRMATIIRQSLSTKKGFIDTYTYNGRYLKVPTSSKYPFSTPIGLYAISPSFRN